MAENEEKLRDYMQKIATEQGYGNGVVDIQAMSSEGANFTTSLYLANISDPPKEDMKLFVKVANISEEIRAANNNMFEILYETERFFYEELAIVFENMYDEHSVPQKDRLQYPNYYGYKSVKMEETMVLENLVAKDFGNFDRLKTFNWDYASKSVEILAKFHALGLAFRHKSREDFNRIIKKIPHRVADENIRKAYVEQAIKTGTQMMNERYKEKMLKFFKTDHLLRQLEKVSNPPADGFLIHSDFRPSNLMQRRRNGKLELILLDFQTLRLGALTTDLMYFIFTGSDVQFRKYHYQQLLDFYYQELTLALKNLHVDINKVYPRETFDKELEETKYVGLFIGLTMMSMLTADSEDTPKMEGIDNMSMTQISSPRSD
ncbi:hypothetical protein MSG28_007840 [Choristoneura fumiferana]|uniref:Uncharacterized protein n=1 Tax=Choristoneura fumiferana TaxID=7141 RepID=A0ACC0J8Y4_CHOFU|nr:hypothetical protein MSG28_007840 [Choristoneura fumiferana]